MCLYPKLIPNPKYKKNGKNRGVIPPLPDARVIMIAAGCGNCIECRKQKARAWRVRLLEDIKKHNNGKYITLTFSNESIKELNESYITKTHIDGHIVKIPIKELEGYEKDNAIATRAVRLFNERWRKEHKKALRHWLVTELGHKGTENIHLHGIIWTNETYDEIEKHWKYGFIWPRKILNKRGIWIRQHTYVNDKTINYNTKYVHKIDKQHKTYKSIILTSPGIGANYTDNIDSKQNKYNGKETKETYRTRTGHKIAIPTYWRNKIYTEKEREKLWLHKLDKEERWICGEKIDISNGDTKEYYNLLKHHRERNTQLGYGDDKKNWKREVYETQRRNIIINTRITNANEAGEVSPAPSKKRT